jgi:hypothetical protein
MTMSKRPMERNVSKIEGPCGEEMCEEPCNGEMKCENKTEPAGDRDEQKSVQAD